MKRIPEDAGLRIEARRTKTKATLEMLEPETSAFVARILCGGPASSPEIVIDAHVGRVAEMNSDDFEDDLDDLISEFCAEITSNLNKFAEQLGLRSRVWYVTVIHGTVVVNRFQAGSMRFFGKRRTAPGQHAWGW